MSRKDHDPIRSPPSLTRLPLPSIIHKRRFKSSSEMRGQTEASTVMFCTPGLDDRSNQKRPRSNSQSKRLRSASFLCRDGVISESQKGVLKVRDNFATISIMSSCSLRSHKSDQVSSNEFVLLFFKNLFQFY